MNQKLKMEKFNSSAALLESWAKLLLSNLQEDLPHVRRILEGAEEIPPGATKETWGLAIFKHRVALALREMNVAAETLADVIWN